MALLLFEKAKEIAQQDPQTKVCKIKVAVRGEKIVLANKDLNQVIGQSLWLKEKK